jgi:hypothetical protein
MSKTTYPLCLPTMRKEPTQNFWEGAPVRQLRNYDRRDHSEENPQSVSGILHNNPIPKAYRY